MVDHLCKGLWVSGRVGNCSNHTQRGSSAADVRPYDDRRTRVRTEGIAKTGEISKKGTVSHKDFWSGKLQAVARPATLHVDIRDMPGWSWKNKRWIHDATGKELAWQTTAQNSVFSGNVTSVN